jgi:hypothetical protein
MCFRVLPPEYLPYHLGLKQPKLSDFATSLTSPQGAVTYPLLFTTEAVTYWCVAPRDHGYSKGGLIA